MQQINLASIDNVHLRGISAWKLNGCVKTDLYVLAVNQDGRPSLIIGHLT